jgi:uncharacterized protein (TIGR02996 family)
MSLHAAFLADVAANFDDDGPRLVYADWLDDNGEADRARFIRAQCRLAAMGRFDPERYDLEWVAADLLKKYARKWLKPLAAVTVNVEFRRGFPYRFALPASKFVEKGEEAFAAAPTLREYRVLQPKGGGWDQMLACPALEKVTSLDPGHQPGITIERTKALANSPRLRNLRELDLSEAALSRCIIDVAASPHLAKLRKLRLYKCGLGPAGLERLLKARFAKNLVALDLAQNELNAPAVGTLAKWKGAARLETLTLLEWHQSYTSRSLGDDAARAFASGDWSSLRELSLSLHRAGTDGLDALARCASLAGLRSLRLYHAGGANADALLASPHLAGLEELHLPGRADHAALAVSPMLPNLRGLSLTMTDEASVRAILSAPAAAGLRELSLRGPKDGRAVAAILAEATHLTGLRKLSLSDMPLGAEGGRLLGGAAHLAGLVELGLSDSCDDEAAGALATAPHLQRLRRLSLGALSYMHRRPAPQLDEVLKARFGEDVVTRN